MPIVTPRTLSTGRVKQMPAPAVFSPARSTTARMMSLHFPSGERVPRRVHGGGLEASVDDADDQSVTHFFTSPLTASSPASNASAAGPLTLFTGTVNAMPVFFSSKRNFSFMRS